jgi:hypothetical protein
MSTRRLTRPPHRSIRVGRSPLGAAPPRTTVLPLLILCLCFCLESSAVADERAAADERSTAPFRLSDLDGRWVQHDESRDASARHAAIDTAIQPLSWVVRKMAGGALHTTTAPEPTVHFVWDGKQLHQRLNGKRGVKVRIVEPGGPLATGFDSRGEPFEGQWLWTPDGLQFRWQQDQAHGANLYHLDPGRQELTVIHRIRITALDGIEPIEFRSRFVKADLPTVSAAGAPAVE